MTNRQAWVGFWLLSVIWGSSYLFIRIGVEQVPPFQLVFIRTAIAASGLTIVVYARGKQLPTDWPSLRDICVLGIVNTVFPFVLIVWGETHIESSLASVLQGTTALFALVVAHFTFADERITLRKVAGLLVGFLGVFILAGRSGGETAMTAASTMHLLGQLAIVLSSLCYAVGGVYGRKAMQNRLDPLVVSAGAMLVAATITGILTGLAPMWGGASAVRLGDLTTTVLVAVLVLGAVNTFGAYLIFYPLVATLGASRTAMVTYVIPVVGVVLGALFLDERIDARLLVGALLILGSIAIVNLNLPSLLNTIRVHLSARPAHERK